MVDNRALAFMMWGYVLSNVGILAEHWEDILASRVPRKCVVAVYIFLLTLLFRTGCRQPAIELEIFLLTSLSLVQAGHHICSTRILLLLFDHLPKQKQELF